MTRRASSQVFVGRVAELDRLDEAFERARNGQPSLVLVAGEAGVGKSRLLAEFSARAEAAGAIALTGGCLDLGEVGLPYAPFVEAIRELGDRLDPGAKEATFGPWAEALAGLLPDARLSGAVMLRDDPGEPADRLARLFDAVIGILGREADVRPVVLVLEDLHWADGSSRDLLRFLVRNIRAERLLIIATYRTDDLHRRHPLRPLLAELERGERVERLELQPFDRDELVQQLTSILARTPSPATVDALLERSDGLPSYVEELVANDEGDGTALPSTLRDVLGLRLATLSRGAAALVGAAAIIGPRCSHERLAALVDVDGEALITALREASDAFVLVPATVDHEPGYAFRHALLREAALEDLLPAERVALHGRLADQLETSIRGIGTRDAWMIADFAVHAHEAHDQPRAFEGSVEAAQAFAGVAAYREALGHATRALELWPRADDPARRVGLDHAELLTIASQAAAATSQPTRAFLFSQQALAELRPEVDPDRRARLLADHYMIAWEAQEFEAGGAAIEEAHALVEAADPSPSKAYVVMSLGWYRWWTDRLAESLALCEEAMAISLATGDDAGWALSASSAAHVLADLGRGTRAAALADRTMASLSESDGRSEVLFAYIDRSIALWTAGRFADAGDIAALGLERATRYGLTGRVGAALRGCLADASFELGRYDEVEAATRPGIAGDGIPNSIAWAALTMARADVVRGRFDDARRLADAVGPEAFAGGFHELTLVDLARAEDRFDDVVSAMESALARGSGERVIPLPMLIAAGVGAAADHAISTRRKRRPADADRAAGHAARWLGILRAMVEGAAADGGAGPFIEACLATAEAELRRLHAPTDPAPWATAASRWAVLAQPHQAASARLRQGEAMLASGQDRVEVASVLVAAHEAAIAIGAEPLRVEIEGVAARGRITLPGTIGPEPAGRGDAPAVTTLTARERDVLDLVAQGHTNREIGDRLFISEKTVSVHVSNAMAKLGALSRYEAAAAAERLGLLSARADQERVSGGAPPVA